MDDDDQALGGSEPRRKQGAPRRDEERCARSLPEHAAGRERLGDLPAESDWRDKGIITPIKDQGQCGSSDDPWPYTSGDTKEDGQFFGNFTAVAKFTGFVKLPENNLAAVMGALATLGPLAVVVDASSWSFYDRWDRGAAQLAGRRWTLDHGVQLVGYGTQRRPLGKSCFFRCEPIPPDSAAPPMSRSVALCVTVAEPSRHSSSTFRPYMIARMFHVILCH